VRFDRKEQERASIEGRDKWSNGKGKKKSFGIGERKNAPPNVL
jgi:hypothetical protein